MAECFSLTTRILFASPLLLSITLSQTTPQNPSYAETEPSITATENQQQQQNEIQPDPSSIESNNLLGMNLTPQTILILVVVLMFSFIGLCIGVGYCIRTRSRQKREAEIARAELRRMDLSKMDSPVHHDLQPIYVKDIKAATLNTTDAHYKTDTLQTGGTYDYAPNRIASKQFSQNVDLYIPQYASTVEEIPPYPVDSHRPKEYGQYGHVYDAHLQPQGRESHRQGRKHQKGRSKKSKGRSSRKYREAVQDEEPRNNHGYGYGRGHGARVVHDEDVIEYNVRDGFAR